jgi:hypothetical protein
MKLCPDQIIPIGGQVKTSSAEVKTFNCLASVNFGPHWTAYHSINCCQHAYKKWAEIDFLLVGAEGCLVIEVKGGRIKRENGIWYYIDRWDQPHRNTEGPFNQAKTAMYALKGLMQSRYGIPGETSDRLVFGWGVIFPDFNWSDDGPENPKELVAGPQEISDPKAMEKYLGSVLEFWRKKHSVTNPLSQNELALIKRKLRPDIDLYPSLSTRVGWSLSAMQRLTEEQYERVDIIEQNERVVITGAAGTGKTFLMMQCARKEAGRGKSVLVVVHNPGLAWWIQYQVQNPLISISAYVNTQVISNTFDVLMVDEGQDLLDFDSLERLSGLLAGGLDKGRWRWFMDPSFQIGISGVFDPEALEYLLTGLAEGPPVRLPLCRNVRNTKEVVDATTQWTGVNIGRSEVRGHGRKPQMFIVRNENERNSKTVKIIDEFRDQGAEFEEIGIVVPLDLDGSLFTQLPPRIKKKLVNLKLVALGEASNGKIVWGAVDEFKGLERPIILAIGFEDERYLKKDVAQLYVAMTRANFGFVALVSPGLGMEIMDKVIIPHSSEKRNN